MDVLTAPVLHGVAGRGRLSPAEPTASDRGRFELPTLVATIASLALACAPAPRETARFGEQHEIARLEWEADDLRLVDTRDGPVALWSAPAGLRLQRLGSRGAPEGAAAHLGPRCEGGLAAHATDGGLVVACARRPRLDKGDPGAVLVLEVVDDEVVARRRLAGLGRDSRGIELAREGEDWVVLWHDGSPERWTVWRARVPHLRGGRLRSGHGASDTPQVDPEPLSTPHLAASSPALVTYAGEAITIWAETWMEAGFPRGHVLATRGRSPSPTLVADVDHEDPAPSVAADERGLVVLFRDLRRPSPRASLFAQRLGDDLRPRGRPARVTRADAERGARGVACLGGLVAVVPRTWDNDTLIGLDLLDLDLKKRVAEQQIYEWAARFTRADAACVDGTLITLVGERASGLSPEARLHTMELRWGAR